MMISIPTFVYHITDLTNLQSIITNKGLQSNNIMRHQEIHFTDIAFDQIQTRRSNVEVPFDPYGNLHDYVPFYFAPRSPMLYTIKQGNVPEYQKGQSSIIYIVSTVQTIISARIPFVFTDGHAIMSYSEFYNNKFEDLDQIDWDVMTSRYWNDTNEHPDRKRKRQSEFLVFEYFPLECITEVGVLNNKVKEEVDSILSK